jgi:hypothetical protein
LVDTNGLILHALVHEANIQDARGGKLLLAPLGGCFPRLELIWADSGYKKEGKCSWVKAELGWDVEIVEHRLLWAARSLGSKGCQHRLGTDPPQWLSCPQAPLGGRANICLALDVAPTFQRL